MSVYIHTHIHSRIHIVYIYNYIGVGITFEPDLRPGSMTHGMFPLAKWKKTRAFSLHQWKGACVRAVRACVSFRPTHAGMHTTLKLLTNTHHSQACTSWRGSVRTLPHTTAAESRHMQSYIHSYVRMYVFMCVCVCMYVFMYLCIYVCMFKCMHACMFICSYVCIDRISISIYLSIYVIYICIPVAQVSQWLLRLYISGWGCARNDSAGRRPQGVCVCVCVLTFGTMITDLSREVWNKLTTPRCVGRCWCLHVSLCV